MSEDSMGDFSFFLFPTTVRNDDVYVNIVAPAALDEKRYVLLNENEDAEILYWAAGSMSPQEVRVTYNVEVRKLAITEVNLLLKLLVDVDGDKTKDERFKMTEQSVLPIDITLIPSINNTAGARSVTVKESIDGTFVAEGPNGFNSTYVPLLVWHSNASYAYISCLVSSPHLQIRCLPTSMLGRNVGRY